MPSLTPFGTLHKVLLQFGYNKDTSHRHHYKQEIDIKGITFPVNIILHDAYFYELPTAFLSHIPEELPTRLPHVMKYLALCYLDETSVKLDRFNTESSITLVLELINNLLKQYVENPDYLQNELRREIDVYWKSKLYNCCYLLETQSRKLSHIVFEKAHLDGDSLEIIIGNDEHLEQWMAKRRGKKISSGTSKIITLDSKTIIPENNWPPNNISELTEWLIVGMNRSAAVQLINFAADSIVSRSSFSVVFKLDTKYFGVLIVVMNTPMTRILRDALNRGGKKKGKKHSINFQQKYSLVKKSFPENESNFYRVKVEDASSRYVVSRNIAGQSSLGGLKIAHIGCGTIGGISANMLFQSGAGTSNGNIDLYDFDIFRPGNLGRHILGMSYLGENKAEAMVDYIKKNSVADVSINAIIDELDPADLVSSAQKYDLIVDATGSYKFSSSLSHLMRKAGIRIPIIFGWVDALGLASRGLLDDGNKSYACYYCVTTANNKTIINDAAYKKGVNIPEWRPEACGIGSYLPFSSQASACAASLIQGLCLDWVNGNPSPRFRHITNDHNKIHHTKSTDLKPQKDCPCCQ